MTALEIKALAIILAIVSLIGAFYWQEQHWTQVGVEKCQASMALAVAKQQAAASAVESQWKDKADAIRLNAEKQAQSLNAALAAARAASLRDRTASRVVMSPTAAASCAGVSPAALSSDDANVALGIAADADRLRDYAIQVQDWLKAVGAVAP